MTNVGRVFWLRLVADPLPSHPPESRKTHRPALRAARKSAQIPSLPPAGELDSPQASKELPSKRSGKTRKTSFGERGRADHVTGRGKRLVSLPHSNVCARDTAGAVMKMCRINFVVVTVGNLLARVSLVAKAV